MLFIKQQLQICLSNLIFIINIYPSLTHLDNQLKNVKPLIYKCLPNSMTLNLSLWPISVTNMTSLVLTKIQDFIHSNKTHMNNSKSIVLNIVNNQENRLQVYFVFNKIDLTVRSYNFQQCLYFNNQHSNLLKTKLELTIQIQHNTRYFLYPDQSQRILLFAKCITFV